MDFTVSVVPREPRAVRVLDEPHTMKRPAFLGLLHTVHDVVGRRRLALLGREAREGLEESQQRSITFAARRTQLGLQALSGGRKATYCLLYHCACSSLNCTPRTRSDLSVCTLYSATASVAASRLTVFTLHVRVQWLHLLLFEVSVTRPSHSNGSCSASQSPSHQQCMQPHARVSLQSSRGQIPGGRPRFFGDGIIVLAFSRNGKFVNLVRRMGRRACRHASCSHVVLIHTLRSPAYSSRTQHTFTRTTASRAADVVNLSASDERAGADVRQERRDEAVMKTL
jgi:hypothetical protein